MAAGNLRRVLVQGRLAIGSNGVVWQNWKLNVACFLRLFARDGRERSHFGVVSVRDGRLTSVLFATCLPKRCWFVLGKWG